MQNKPRTVSLHQRPSLVQRESLGSALPPLAGMGSFLNSLPDIYAGGDLRKLSRHWAHCARQGHAIGMGFGAHVIKVGVQAHLMDWVERGALKFLATHGASAIHDVELAMAGKTSEDVAASLEAGRFGMAGETVELWQAALQRVRNSEMGLGEALGTEVLAADFPHTDLSLLAHAVRAQQPIAVLVAIGTDTVHVHPDIDAAALGEGSLRDFRRLCDFVQTLAEGLWINLGSAVILPEAFLKGVALARNAGVDLSGMMTVVLDMIRHYRPTANVQTRPPGEGLQLIGQHEVLIPLLHQAVCWYMENPVESHHA